jgi:hypothetical protein
MESGSSVDAHAWGIRLRHMGRRAVTDSGRFGGVNTMSAVITW